MILIGKAISVDGGYCSLAHAKPFFVLGVDPRWIALPVSDLLWVLLIERR